MLTAPDPRAVERGGRGLFLFFCVFFFRGSVSCMLFVLLFLLLCFSLGGGLVLSVRLSSRRVVSVRFFPIWCLDFLNFDGIDSDPVGAGCSCAIFLSLGYFCAIF